MAAVAPAAAAARSFGGGRLRPSLLRFRGIAERLAKTFPNENKNYSVRLMDIREKIAGNLTREYMTLLMGAVAFVLLIACANVANLQLARATGRYREGLEAYLADAARCRARGDGFEEATQRANAAVLADLTTAWHGTLEVILVFLFVYWRYRIQTHGVFLFPLVGGVVRLITHFAWPALLAYISGSRGGAPGLGSYTMDSDPPVRPDAQGRYPVAMPGKTRVL